MRNYKVFLTVLMVGLSACGGGKIRRTLETDARMRVLIDPRIPAEHYVQIRRALVQSHKFEVVDRAEGLEAALHEQDLQAYSGRFGDRERWALMGQMYGARGIFTAHADCYQDKNFWGTFKRYCKQDLAFIDGMTGVVEFEVSGLNSETWTASPTVPDWNEVVQAAVEQYPEYFEPRVIKGPLAEHMDRSEAMAKQMRAPAQGVSKIAPADMDLLKQAQTQYLNQQE